MIFNEKSRIDLTKATLHSGAAEGSDLCFQEVFETIGKGSSIKHYTHKTKYHTNPYCVEISEEDFQEGVNEVRIANKSLKRHGIEKYMNLLARNWAQVKYSEEIFAIGYSVKEKDGSIRFIEGGTQYCVEMGINHNRPINFYCQNDKQWYEFSYISDRFIKCDLPFISKLDFAGIGSRRLLAQGRDAIVDLINNSII